MIGVVKLDDYRRATVADIPGLIEGAHENLGLGHAFLLVTSRGAGCSFSSSIWRGAKAAIRSKISSICGVRSIFTTRDCHSVAWRVVANKMDLPEAEENLATLRQRYPKLDVVPVSAKENEGIENLQRTLDSWLLEGEPKMTGGIESSYEKAAPVGRGEYS